MYNYSLLACQDEVDVLGTACQRAVLLREKDLGAAGKVVRFKCLLLQVRQITSVNC